MSAINVTTGKSYNFHAPTANVGGKINEVPFPMVEAQSEVAAAAAIDIAANVQVSVVPLQELTEAATLNVTPADDLGAGAILILHVPCGATAYDLTLGDGCETGTVTGVQNTTKKAVLVYDGTTFIPTGVAFD